MSARPPIRIWSANANVALIIAAAAAVLVVAAFVSAVVIDPPLLAWVGFALASSIVVSLTAEATLLVPRMRVSAAGRPSPATRVGDCSSARNARSATAHQTHAKE